MLKQYFGYDQFREGQTDLIEAVLNGRDVLGIHAAFLHSSLTVGQDFVPVI